MLGLFLKVLINLRNPNYENGDSPSFRTHLGLIQIPLKVKDIPELVSIGLQEKHCKYRWSDRLDHKQNCIEKDLFRLLKGVGRGK